MLLPSKPENESERLQALARYDVLDSAAEGSYDEITAFVAKICGTPIAVVSLVDENRQWFKSHYGLVATQTPRDISFCAHAILQPEQVMIVPDAARDERFVDNPLVTGAPNIGFYAGTPLVTDDGYALGTLCVIDTAARTVTAEQLEALRLAGRTVLRLMEQRYTIKLLETEIAERRRVEERLSARTLEAEAATASKSQFLANMSHEIRSPMNAILGMLQLLQRTELSARQSDYAAKACVATQALLRLLTDILDFSKIEAGQLMFEKMPFEIDTMMRDVSTLLSASLGTKPIAFVFANDPHLPKRLQGDAFRLRQVLLNLAGNAIKFTAQGEIIIEIRQVAQRPDCCDIEFAVTDTGIGIAPEQLTAIFTGFNQGESSTTRRYGGTGLGLAISQRIVSLMGGRLDVESAVGSGSRFHFTLTFDRVDDSAALDSPRPPKRPSARHEQVLIVDGNEHARKPTGTKRPAASANCQGWPVLPSLP